ncbi:MAG: RnfABCDGE type electron transport complex subunit D [Bacillota bacterium]|nr:RnfABCDGE type electron transport complex subunit D [Bacillota bacterium]
MTFKKWLKTPKAYVAFAMIVYLLIASIGYKNALGIKNGLVAVIASVIVDIFMNMIKKRKWTIPDGAIITGLIISLILSTATSLAVIAGTAVIAILSKHIIVYKKKPIFNPAAFGLLLSVLIFQTGQSWWGAFGDLPAWTILFLLIGGYLLTNRINKFVQVFTFLGTSFLLLVLMAHFNIGDAMDAFRPPFINATLFFGFFMLTDPPTSPGKNGDQLIFGLLTAAIGTIIYALFGGLIYLFIGLCFGNLYSYLKKRSTSKVALSRSSMKKTQRSLS